MGACIDIDDDRVIYRFDLNMAFAATVYGCAPRSLVALVVARARAPWTTTTTTTGEDADE